MTQKCGAQWKMLRNLAEKLFRAVFQKLARCVASAKVGAGRRVSAVRASVSVSQHKMRTANAANKAAQAGWLWEGALAAGELFTDEKIRARFCAANSHNFTSRENVLPLDDVCGSVIYLFTQPIHSPTHPPLRHLYTFTAGCCASIGK